jgi:hypothetical protein
MPLGAGGGVLSIQPFVYLSSEVGKSDDIRALTIILEALLQLEKRLGGWTGA